MEKYEVIIRDRETGNRWSLVFLADDFGHAEEQAISGNYANPKHDEIIQIVKDYA